MDNESQRIQSLLNHIGSIVTRYEALNKAREDSGALFNIFEVLELTASEVYLHSAFIASLLRPDKHGAGRKFLEAFLMMPALNLPEGYMNIESVRVEKELDIGPKTDDSGGRIDLFLTDGTHHIIIENKIYASDQYHQLLRYHNYRPDGKLVYLTLFEDEKPSKDSLGGLDSESVTCISYKYDIVQWLKECVQVSANLPFIRETINQYINTIQLLTDTDMGTNSEIMRIISRPENLESAFEIKNNLDGCMNTIMNGFVQDLSEELIRVGSPFTCKPSGTDWFRSYMRLDFIHKRWDKVVLATEFEARGFKDMIVGLLKKSDVESILSIEDALKMAEGFGWPKKNNNWVWGTPPSYIPTYWNNATVMKSLLDGSMIQPFIMMLDEVSKRAEGLEL